MNVCRYITGIESLFFSHIIIWGSITIGPFVYGLILVVEAPEWHIQLGYPSDMRRTRSHEIYVISPFPNKFSDTKFSLYYLSKPNMRVLEVELK